MPPGYRRTCPQGIFARDRDELVAKAELAFDGIAHHAQVHLELPHEAGNLLAPTHSGAV